MAHLALKSLGPAEAYHHSVAFQNRILSDTIYMLYIYAIYVPQVCLWTWEQILYDLSDECFKSRLTLSVIKYHYITTANAEHDGNWNSLLPTEIVSLDLNLECSLREHTCLNKIQSANLHFIKIFIIYKKFNTLSSTRSNINKGVCSLSFLLFDWETFKRRGGI